MAKFYFKGPQVRKLLDDHDMTMSDGAHRLRVSRSYFSQLVNRVRALSPRIRRCLKEKRPFNLVPVDDLVDRVDEARE